MSLMSSCAGYSCPSVAGGFETFEKQSYTLNICCEHSPGLYIWNSGQPVLIFNDVRCGLSAYLMSDSTTSEHRALRISNGVCQHSGRLINVYLVHSVLCAPEFYTTACSGAVDFCAINRRINRPAHWNPSLVANLCSLSLDVVVASFSIT